MKEKELYRALDASITGCQPSDYWKNRMVRQIVKGEEMKKRTKLSAMLSGNKIFQLHPYSDANDIFPELDKILNND